MLITSQRLAHFIMHRHYCTLSDIRYLAKFLTLYESLVAHSSDDFTLHYLAMDDESFWIVDQLELRHVKTVPLAGFEHAMNMIPVKESRNKTEYFWSCASNFMEYLLHFDSIDALTYLDADLWFMSDPKVVFDEISHRSIAIVPHRFIKEKQYLERNGKFNVSWVTARNNEIGRSCIERWASQVREWCYNRIERHHACGDQKYLDEFPMLYGEECCVISNIGANLAPWNLANYRISYSVQTKEVSEDFLSHRFMIMADDTPAIWFHAHEFKDECHLTNYELRDEDMLIYRPYIDRWQAANDRIANAQMAIAERREELHKESERA